MTRLLPTLALTLLAVAGCSDPKTDEAWTTCEHFTQSVHSGDFTEARSMTAGKTAWGWFPKIEREVAASEMKNWKFGSVDLDRKTRSRTGDTVEFTSNVTVTYVDRRNGLDVVFLYVLGGGEWFRPDETRRYREEITLTLIDGTWKVTHFEFRKIDTR